MRGFGDQKFALRRQYEKGAAGGPFSSTGRAAACLVLFLDSTLNAVRIERATAIVFDDEVFGHITDIDTTGSVVDRYTATDGRNINRAGTVDDRERIPNVAGHYRTRAIVNPDVSANVRKGNLTGAILYGDIIVHLPNIQRSGAVVDNQYEAFGNGNIQIDARTAFPEAQRRFEMTQ